MNPAVPAVGATVTHSAPRGAVIDERHAPLSPGGWVTGITLTGAFGPFCRSAEPAPESYHQRTPKAHMYSLSLGAPSFSSGPGRRDEGSSHVVSPSSPVTRRRTLSVMISGLVARGPPGTLTALVGLLKFGSIR